MVRSRSSIPGPLLECISSCQLFWTHSESNLSDATYISTLFFLLNTALLSCLVTLTRPSNPAVSCNHKEIKKKLSDTHTSWPPKFYHHDLLLLSSSPTKHSNVNPRKKDPVVKESHARGMTRTDTGAIDTELVT